jgi:hypothetical protein
MYVLYAYSYKLQVYFRGLAIELRTLRRKTKQGAAYKIKILFNLKGTIYRGKIGN